MKISRNSCDTRQWLGVAYAHIPTRSACRPFAKIAYKLTRIFRKTIWRKSND